MSRYAGKSGVIYIADTGAAAAHTTVSLDHWSLDQSTSKENVTAFGDLNMTYVQGFPDLKGAIGGFWDDADDTLFKAASSVNGTNLYLYPSKDAPTKYWYGPAWLDAKIDTPAQGPVKIDASFVARGSWGRL